MKKLSYILSLLSVFFLSCSNLAIENFSEAETGHNFQVQKLFYDATFALAKGNELYVVVYADGCTCTKCGTKYHTNELFYGQIDESEFEESVIAKYRTMGYGKAVAYQLANQTLNEVRSGLYAHYLSLGFEKTSYEECIK